MVHKTKMDKSFKIQNAIIEARFKYGLNYTDTQNLICNAFKISKGRFEEESSKLDELFSRG